MTSLAYMVECELQLGAGGTRFTSTYPAFTQSVTKRESMI